MKIFAEVKKFDRNTMVVVMGFIGLCCCLASSCYADIANDLKPIDGYVVKAGENEFVIDLDATHGIEAGDIFSVMGPGEELIHPVTQKIIGRLEEVKGVLKVIRISDGYSFARPIGEAAEIKRGDRIRRFSALKAVFWDYSDTNRPLFDHLQNTLPFLTWQDYKTSQIERPPKPSPLVEQSAILIFIVQNNILEIRDAQYGLLRKYPVGEASAIGRAGASIPHSSVDSSAAPLSTTLTTSAYEKNTPSIINYGPATSMAQLSDNTLMAELLKQNGERMLATTDGNKISIFGVFNSEQQLKLLAEGKIDGYGKILTVKWWQPEAGGMLYLAVLAWTDDKIDSTVFKFENNRLSTVEKGLDSILGSFDLDKDGRPETLLSQNFDADSFFGRRIQEMYWHNAQLKQKNITLELPSKFTVIGGLLADLTGDGKLEAAYVRNGSLWVYSGNKKLYVSPKQMGGSLSALTYKVDPTLLDYRSTSVFFEVAPIAVDIDADGRKELLVVSSDQSAIKAPGLMTTIDKSRIIVFNYEKGAFVRGTVGEPVDAAIQGLGADGRQILFVATDPGSLFDQGGSSQLQILDIAF
jgi:hypothetical protein